MKLQKSTMLLLMCLLFTQLMITAKHDGSMKGSKHSCVFRTKEFDALLVKMSDALLPFIEKHTNNPRLLCTTCKTGTLEPGAVLVAVWLYTFAGPKHLDASTKLMAEALDVFSRTELDEVVAFIARTANYLELDCSDRRCYGKNWDAIKYE